MRSFKSNENIQKKEGEVYEDMVEILLMRQVFLVEDPEIEYLFCDAPSGSETRLLFCNDLLVVGVCLGWSSTWPF